VLPLFFSAQVNWYNENVREAIYTMFAADIPQTIKRAYQDIREGGEPWVAIGDFSHDWHRPSTSAEGRAALVVEPITLPDEPTLEQRQWAAFCAASVEYLCEQAGIPAPAWIENPAYILADAEAFFTSPAAASKPRVRERLKQEAPPAFKRRNVYCSARVYASKYHAAPVHIKRSA
jgi:hypothetical protein